MSASQVAPAAALAQHYSSVAVGTDFTPCSAVAIGQALRIAAWSGVPPHVIHVIDITVVDELESALSTYQQAIRDSLVKDAEKAWGEFAAKIPGAVGLPIHVSINNRIFGILKRTRERHADLLVLGAFGDRAPDVGVGTVATACVRKSMTDVLLVRDTHGGKAPFRTIVAAVDFSPTSLRAVARAAMIAARESAALHILHVFKGPWNQLHYRAPTPLAPPHLQKQYRDSLERRLSEFCRPVLEPNASPQTRFELYDYAGHRSGIVEYAAKVSADLIVLGTRGRTNIRDILLGSTAEKVLEESRCSVLAVKPEGFQHPMSADVEPHLVTTLPAF